jgi:hypothetical protein
MSIITPAFLNGVILACAIASDRAAAARSKGIIDRPRIGVRLTGFFHPDLAEPDSFSGSGF